MIHGIVRKVKRFVADQSGPTAVEYAVLLNLIIIICIVGIEAVGGITNSGFQKAAKAMSEMTSEWESQPSQEETSQPETSQETTSQEGTSEEGTSQETTSQEGTSEEGTATGTSEPTSETTSPKKKGGRKKD